jgi:hypothetical protein
MNLLSLLPVLLSVLGRNKPELEGPLKGVIGIIGKLTQPELEEPIEQVDVATAQEKLAAHGYDVGAADGFAGMKTRTALMEFQKDNNLVVDGLLGQKTWAALKRI